MHRWLISPLLVAGPCLLALLAYDAVAIFLLGRGENRLAPMHDWAGGALQDLGLAVVYAMTVTPRVINVVAGFPQVTRRLCLIMLGLGIAWYDVLCAAATRVLAEPPGLALSLVVLFVVPVILAPGYVRWLGSKLSA
ncbi:MAG: hypothetical protein E6K68_08310 [Nitrospirae bacterium]|nr:MAG: hypothetical protein E6K68_08310 [Nitrospirota bacterium]